jgi:hypothetical protein
LAKRVDDEDASHIQVVVKVVLPEAAGHELKRLAEEAGIAVSITPIS